MIDTLNDPPNVLWIVSQEASLGSEWWDNHLIHLACAYEAGKPFQHPIGMNLAAMRPRRDLSSTGRGLASVDAVHSKFLIYAPTGGTFTVNLSGVDGTLAVEWMDPAKGSRIAGASVGGGTNQTFRPPFTGDAVLYLHKTTPGADSK